MGLDQYITKKTCAGGGGPAALGGEHRFCRFYGLHGWMQHNVGLIWNEKDLIVPRASWEKLQALCNRLLPYRALLAAPPHVPGPVALREQMQAAGLPAGGNALQAAREYLSPQAEAERRKRLGL